MPAPTALPTGTFGHHIREERERRGLTQTELGAITGLGQSGVSRIERGQTPDAEDILALSQGFGVTAKTVYGWWYSARRATSSGPGYLNQFIAGVADRGRKWGLVLAAA